MKNRYTILLLSLLLAFPMQKVYAQGKRIHLSQERLSLRQIFIEIQDQTGLGVIYSSKELSPAAVVSLRTTDWTMDALLERLAKEHQYGHKRIRGYIILSPTLAAAAPERPLPVQVPEPVRETKKITPLPSAPIAQVPVEPVRQQTDSPVAPPTIPPASRSLSVSLLPRPRFVLKTNLLYAATLSANITAELWIDKHWSAELLLGYAPNICNEGGLQHFLIQPATRYWTRQSFQGHFVGLHGSYINYNAGTLYTIKGIDFSFLPQLNHYRLAGYGVGAGLSYGYRIPLSKRWGMEFELGIGYFYFKYEHYHCFALDEYEGTFTKHYFGPTKAAISLTFSL